MSETKKRNRFKDFTIIFGQGAVVAAVGWVFYKLIEKKAEKS